MRKRTWFLLILAVLLVFGYIRFFHKSFTNISVPASADCIMALDVKRISNRLIWNAITTPSGWSIGNIFSGKKKTIGWADIIKTPDFGFFFHSKGQPWNAWYCLLPLKNDESFYEGIALFNFQKTGTNEYISREYHLAVFKAGDQVLLSNASVEDPHWLAEVKQELLVAKKFISQSTLQELADQKSQLAIRISGGSLLAETAMITADFNKEQVSINGSFRPAAPYVFAENNFAYSSHSIFTLAFTQPDQAIYNLVGDSTKEKISKTLGFNIDSLMLPTNKWYNLDIAGVHERPDTAISYSYDEEFNKKENRVINNVREPSLNFEVYGNQTDLIHGYWLRDSVLEDRPAGELFTAVPFVKAWYSSKDNMGLTLSSVNYKASIDTHVDCIFFQRLLFTAIPAGLFNYLPDKISKSIGNIELVETVLKKENGLIRLAAVITKKKNDLPLFGN